MNFLYLLAVAAFATSAVALSTAKPVTKVNVLVTGAAGRTGKLVFEFLQNSDVFSPIACVRTEKSKSAFMRKQPDADKAKVVVADVTTDVRELTSSFAKENADALIICTSAVPKIMKRSILKVILYKLLRKEGARPEFRFIPNGTPYVVDYLSAVRQIDAAKNAGIKHVIVVSSMGGTQPENFLNTIGKKESDEYSGNILLWKRKAEKHLIESGLDYTIIHPGGLLDQPGGEREIVFGVNDALLQEKVRSIPRSDVARVCVQALSEPAARNRSFDIISKAPGAEGAQVTNDWTHFFSKTGNCNYDE